MTLSYTSIIFAYNTSRAESPSRTHKRRKHSMRRGAAAFSFLFRYIPTFIYRFDNKTDFLCEPTTAAVYAHVSIILYKCVRPIYCHISIYTHVGVVVVHDGWKGHGGGGFTRMWCSGPTWSGAEEGHSNLIYLSAQTKRERNSPRPLNSLVHMYIYCIVGSIRRAGGSRDRCVCGDGLGLGVGVDLQRKKVFEHNKNETKNTITRGTFFQTTLSPPPPWALGVGAKNRGGCRIGTFYIQFIYVQVRSKLET